MEKLTRRSDNICETSSGKFAIIPRVTSGKKGDTSYFEFKPNVLGDVIHVEWPSVAEMIVVDPAIATTMLRLGYAFGPTDEQLDKFNTLVDAYNKSQEDANEKAKISAKEAADKAAKAADDEAKKKAATPPPPPAPEPAKVAAPVTPPAPTPTPKAPEPKAPATT